MKQGAQKSKGNAFENKIAKELSLWISNKERSDIFDRSPASGAKATLNFLKNSDLFANQTGDIVALDKEGYPLTKQFVLECKHHKLLNLEGLFYQTKSGIVSFWPKLITESIRVDKEPFIIMRQNYRDILIGLSQKGIKLFDLDQCVLAHIKWLDMYILPWQRFITYADPKALTTKIQKIGINK